MKKVYIHFLNDTSNRHKSGINKTIKRAWNIFLKLFCVQKNLFKLEEKFFSKVNAFLKTYFPCMKLGHFFHIGGSQTMNSIEQKVRLEN